MKGRKTGGRRKGTPNKVTAEARAVCAAILDDPTYRTNLTARARAGALAPAVETMLWHYAFGKPKDSLNVTIGPAGDLSELSDELPEGALFCRRGATIQFVEMKKGLVWNP